MKVQQKKGNRFRQKRGHTYIPIKTTKKKRHRKLHDADFQGQPESVVMEGIRSEKMKFKWKTITGTIVLLVGVVLIIFDIRDAGLAISFLGLNYSGSLVGGAVAILGLGILYKNDIKIVAKN